MEQQQRLTGHKLKEALVDRGYPGKERGAGNRYPYPKTFGNKLTSYRKTKLKEGFTQRAAIEPKIGHLKADHRLSRNFYKGIKGDNINVMLAAAAMNFKRMMNIWKDNLLALFLRFIHLVQTLFQQPNYNINPPLLTF
ncbi:transposase [Mucilaginibacter pineti]|uniref:transposase n=1 Tax=Mucilaginibacter pineti TaxID=1391627 RepID=UPI00373FDE56